LPCDILFPWCASSLQAPKQWGQPIMEWKHQKLSKINLFSYMLIISGLLTVIESWLTHPSITVILISK
jgi:hypothetical protein